MPLLAAVLAALSLAAAAQHPIASPVWSFDGTRIAWAEASGGGQHEIWAANADGTNQHRIAPGIDSLFEFAWLPSGDFLYDANYRLFRVGSDGKPRPVGSGVTFSVDRKGALVAYQTANFCPSCHGPIEVLSLSSGKTWQVAPTGQNLFPALSPDGRWVAFTRLFASRGRYNKDGGIWIAPSRGGTPVQRTKTGACPEWSPNGRRLVYAGATGLHLIDRSGGAGTLILRDNNLPVCSAKWAPDGKSVAASTSHGHLLVIDLATHASRQIGPKNSLEFVWAPDSSRLLVTGANKGQTCPSLWSVKPDGSALRRLRGC